jgi:hypothetical protein
MRPMEKVKETQKKWVEKEQCGEEKQHNISTCYVRVQHVPNKKKQKRGTIVSISYIYVWIFMHNDKYGAAKRVQKTMCKAVWVLHLIEWYLLSSRFKDTNLMKMGNTSFCSPSRKEQRRRRRLICRKTHWTTISSLKLSNGHTCSCR